MVRAFIIAFSISLFLIVGVWLYARRGSVQTSSIISFAPNAPTPKTNSQAFKNPFDRYTIEALSNYPLSGSTIAIDETSKQKTDEFTTATFYVTSGGRRISGRIHIPSSPKPLDGYPVIFQIRGYVDPKEYAPGMGTKRSSEVYSRNGFVAIAPDYLGYGSSDEAPKDIFEERFLTFTATLDLLDAITRFSLVDRTKIGIWGHSNGGQIALTILESISRHPSFSSQKYPTVLWAPVSASFPYSITFYMNKFTDKGKLLRQELSKFEAIYDVEKYSLSNYLDFISSPLLIHQGTVDDSVPRVWNDTLMKSLKKLKKDVVYDVHPGVDHQMNSSTDPGTWTNIMASDLEFYRRLLLPK
ncbi:prolyl oligopeptidase family serine peptidase [Candidatus Gottesmanbacteria bacterium]|nr:prolyl oligopeptidase family serine peptidase [Candidatus Gottesmanbacteria bacterium]